MGHWNGQNFQLCATETNQKLTLSDPKTIVFTLTFSIQSFCNKSIRSLLSCHFLSIDESGGSWCSLDYSTTWSTFSDRLRNAIYTLWDKDIILVRHCSLVSILKNPEKFEQSCINIKVHVYHAQTITPFSYNLYNPIPTNYRLNFPLKYLTQRRQHNKAIPINGVFLGGMAKDKDAI